MSGHTPVAALNDRANYQVKALYYAFGFNGLIDALPGLPNEMKVNAVEFARLYSEQFTDAEHVINIADCLKMYVEGKRVFSRV